MNKPLLCLLFLLLAISACQKKRMCCTMPDYQTIVGKWKWAFSITPTMSQVAPGLGVEKTLEFDSQGNLTVVHNDVIQNNAFLDVWNQPSLLATPKTDNGPYTLGTQKAGCVNYSYPSVQALGVTYPYSISHDSLYIGSDPCLAPFTTIYIRQ